MLVGVRPVVPPSPDDGGSLTWSCTNTPYLQIDKVGLLLLFYYFCFQPGVMDDQQVLIT